MDILPEYMQNRGTEKILSAWDFGPDRAVGSVRMGGLHRRAQALQAIFPDIPVPPVFPYRAIRKHLGAVGE
jgi:hypothetical protein